DREEERRDRRTERLLEPTARTRDLQRDAAEDEHGAGRERQAEHRRRERHVEEVREDARSERGRDETRRRDPRPLALAPPGRGRGRVDRDVGGRLAEEI